MRFLHLQLFLKNAPFVLENGSLNIKKNALKDVFQTSRSDNLP